MLLQFPRWLPCWESRDLEVLRPGPALDLWPSWPRPQSTGPWRGRPCLQEGLTQAGGPQSRRGRAVNWGVGAPGSASSVLQERSNPRMQRREHLMGRNRGTRCRGCTERGLHQAHGAATAAQQGLRVGVCERPAGGLEMPLQGLPPHAAARLTPRWDAPDAPRGEAGRLTSAAKVSSHGRPPAQPGSSRHGVPVAWGGPAKA